MKQRTCTECGKEFPQAVMTSKVIMFKEHGRDAKVKKSRTVAWLCPHDLVQDPAWNRPLYTSAPSFEDN